MYASSSLTGSLTRFTSKPRTTIHVRGVGTSPLGEAGSIHDGTHVQDVLSFDLPIRQAHGPEVLEGEALDRWFGVNVLESCSFLSTRCFPVLILEPRALDGVSIQGLFSCVSSRNTDRKTVNFS